MENCELWIQTFKKVLSTRSDVAGLDKKLWQEDETLQLDDLGDGNLNAVYRIFSKTRDSPSLVLKHSPPYIKILGPGYPLGPGRLRIEYNALTRFNQLFSGSVPHVYFFDQDKNILCMEYLEGYCVLRKSLLKGEFHPDVARQLGRFMAAIHGSTHSSKLTSTEMEKLDKEFQNSELVSLTEQFVFTRPFKSDDETNKNPELIKKDLHLVYENNDILSAVGHMKSLFRSKKECLVHGDLHTGSIMVKGSSAKVIDAEFAFIGPAALDVGMLIANYLMSYFCHMSTAENNDFHRSVGYKMIDATRLTVYTYFDEIDVFSGGTKERRREELISEVAGMVGCEILRRIIGAAQIEDFKGPGVDPLAQVEGFHAGIRLLSSYRTIKSVDQLIVTALQLT